MPQRRVCSWCDTEMAPGVEPATHGICNVCLARQVAEFHEYNARQRGHTMGRQGTAVGTEAGTRPTG
jgi:hypothetical protein